MAMTIHEHKYDPSIDIFDRRLIGMLDYFSLSYDSADDGQKDAMLDIIKDAESRLYSIDEQIYGSEFRDDA